MNSKYLLGGLLAATMLAAPAFAQTAPAPSQAPAAAPRAAVTAPAPALSQTGQWRASKLVGLNVYNEQNEKLGDISEILLDQSGKVQGVVIGVGGFLGLGQHDILVTFDKLKWVNEPLRTSAASPATTTAPATTATGAAQNSSMPARPARVTTEKWYPDHAILSGTKDQLKAMPAFKYN